LGRDNSDDNPKNQKDSGLKLKRGHGKTGYYIIHSNQSKGVGRFPGGFLLDTCGELVAEKKRGEKKHHPGRECTAAKAQVRHEGISKDDLSMVEANGGRMGSDTSGPDLSSEKRGEKYSCRTAGQKRSGMRVD